MTSCNGVAQEKQDLIWLTGLLQILCFFRCLHALTSFSSSSLPWLPGNYKKDQRACWRKPPCRTLHGFGFSFLENAAGQSGLGFGGNISLWNLALHEHWSWGKWCISIITKINAFTDSKLASDLFLWLSCSPSIPQINSLGNSGTEVSSLCSRRFPNNRYPIQLRIITVAGQSHMFTALT